MAPSLRIASAAASSKIREALELTFEIPANPTASEKSMAKPVICESPDEAVGKKRTRPASEIAQRAAKKNRQDDVIKAMGDKACTERTILGAVGDNRYTREILRRLMALQVVTRVGKGGSNDPFLYRVVKGACIEEMLLVDPALEVRLQRIEVKIAFLLREAGTNVTEKVIRSEVGDNTGTGKALRRLVVAGRVIREGRGGAGNPFTYKIGEECLASEVPPPSSAKSVAAPAPPGKSHKKAAPLPKLVIPKHIERVKSQPSPTLSSACVTPACSPSHIGQGGSLVAPGSVSTTARASVVSCCSSRSDDESDGEEEEDDDSYMDRMSSGDSDEVGDEDQVDLCDGDANFAITHSDVTGGPHDGEGLEMGDLTVIGRACGIVVHSIEEAIAMSNPMPGSDALVASFMADFV